MFARTRSTRAFTAMSQLLRGRREATSPQPSAVQIFILHRVQQKGRIGSAPTLRSLHLLLDMEQSAALKWLRDLETQQLLAIEAHPHDLLEAKISITERGDAWLDKAMKADGE
ncbi:hypothetical protein BPTFM16_00981 [Altererythrobacter insulae]|nr:hypothetical protein BPTFM16_00981 [Altererythrobacter insulae]